MATGWRNPKHDLAEQSKVVIEQGFALSLALLTMIFLTYKTFEVQAYVGEGTTEYVNIEEIPETEQMKKPPPPQRPQIPVPTESEDIPEDVTIMDTELDLDAPPPPAATASGRERAEGSVSHLPGLGRGAGTDQASAAFVSDDGSQGRSRGESDPQHRRR